MQPTDDTRLVDTAHTEEEAWAEELRAFSEEMADDHQTRHGSAKPQFNWMLITLPCF